MPTQVEIGASSKKRPSAAKADGSSAEDGGRHAAAQTADQFTREHYILKMGQCHHFFALGKTLALVLRAGDAAAAEDLGRANSLSAAYAAAEEKKR